MIIFMHKDYLAQIKRVAREEFPVTNQYRDKLYVLAVQFITHSRMNEQQIEASLDTWEKALREMRTATKVEDIKTIQDESFKQIIIRTNKNKDTNIIKSSDKSIDHELYKFVMYQDILMLYGIALSKGGLTAKDLHEISAKTDITLQEMEDFYREHLAWRPKSIALHDEN